MSELDTPGVPALISRRILTDINHYAIRTYYEPHRWHLGASLIGHECSRYLWYVFRWCGTEDGRNTKDESKEDNFGRSLRLFNRGHLEENRYVEFLKGIGCTIWTHDEGGKQFRMSAVNGHFGGSIDGVLQLPPSYKIEEPVLAEFKTNGTGATFSKLFDDGLAVVKPQHFTQMSCYGNEYKLRYGVYFNTNKNDDDLYIEVVKLNWNQAEQFKAKAERIILSEEPPPRLAENPTYFKCSYCSMKGVCHERKLPEMNCRSCKFARPAEAGEWKCNYHGALIPREYVPKGCEHYTAITNAA